MSIIKSSVTYSKIQPPNFAGTVYWCRFYDDSNFHWCDVQDGYWRDSPLDSTPYATYVTNDGTQVVDSLTCQTVMREKLTVSTSETGLNYLPSQNFIITEILFIQKYKFQKGFNKNSAN